MHISEALYKLSPHFLFQVNIETLENVQIPSSKLYINSYACRLTEPTFEAEITTYFWKVAISHIIQNHWKKLALFWVLQFPFNCGTCPIRQLPSLKLPMDSKCIQATSLKSIFAPNVRRDFPIYIARQSAT